MNEIFNNNKINNFGVTTPTIVGVSVSVVSWPLHFLGATYYDKGRGLQASGIEETRPADKEQSQVMHLKPEALLSF